MSALAERLRQCQAKGEPAMGLFLTSGFPELNATLPILEAFCSTADFVELGMPFSDPLAEGPPIQRSSERALRNGAQMHSTLTLARQFTRRHSQPLVLMGYLNPIFRYGPTTFCKAAKDAGVSGLIMPDLPLEESAIIAEPASQAGLDLIYLVAPNTPESRVQKIDQQSTGFVYAVSVTGVTGSGLTQRISEVEAYLRRIRPLVRQNPLLVGFGIRTHAEANRLCKHADGFIVGSALVELIERLWDNRSLTDTSRLEAITAFARNLRLGEDPSCGTIVT